MLSMFMLVGIAFVFGFVLGLSTGLHLHPDTDEDNSKYLWNYSVEYKKEPNE